MKTPEIIEYPARAVDPLTSGGSLPLDDPENGCFERVFELTPTGMAISDARGRFLRVNGAFCRMLGYSAAEIMDPARVLTHPEDAATDAVVRKRLAETGVGAVAVEKRYLRRDGSVMRAMMHMIAHRDDSGTVRHLFTQVVDMSDLYNAREQAEFLAHTDTLTGLANRRRLIREIFDRIDGTLGSRERFSLLFLGLDRFKIINDMFGHGVGDRLLFECGRRISHYIPGSAVVGRLGGDEFAVILDDADTDRAITTAADLTGALQRAFDIDHHHLRVRASIGIASYPADAENANDLVRRADLAMIRCKASQDAYRAFSPELEASLGDWNDYGDIDLEEANRDLRFALQPVFEIDTQRVAFSEVLARIPWEQGFLSPQWIIPMAEASGTIGRFDAAVLAGVLESVHAGRIELPISINVSALSLSDASFAPRLIGSIHRLGLDPRGLIIEVTETAALPDIASARQNAVELRAEGLRIALDDWGSGNTSFAAMRTVPFDVLKIDAALVWGIGSNSHDEMLIRHIVQMGTETGFDAVAEGVETDVQLAWLREQGCRFAQGYLLARPRLVEP